MRNLLSILNFISLRSHYKEYGLKQIVLSGAPGTGKSSLLNFIQEQNPWVKIIHEPAREIIKEQKLIAGRGHMGEDPELFCHLFLSRCLYNIKLNTPPPSEQVVFDRSVIDCLAYAYYFRIPVDPFLRAAKLKATDQQCFLFHPWSAIYCNDHERTIGFEESCKFQECFIKAFKEAGISSLNMPQGSLEERYEFITPYLES